MHLTNTEIRSQKYNYEICVRVSRSRFMCLCTNYSDTLVLLSLQESTKVVPFEPIELMEFTHQILTDSMRLLKCNLLYYVTGSEPMCNFPSHLEKSLWMMMCPWKRREYCYGKGLQKMILPACYNVSEWHRRFHVTITWKEVLRCDDGTRRNTYLCSLNVCDGLQNCNCLLYTSPSPRD